MNQLILLLASSLAVATCYPTFLIGHDGGGGAGAGIGAAISASLGAGVGLVKQFAGGAGAGGAPGIGGGSVAIPGAPGIGGGTGVVPEVGVGGGSGGTPEVSGDQGGDNDDKKSSGSAYHAISDSLLTNKGSDEGASAHHSQGSREIINGADGTTVDRSTYEESGSDSHRKTQDATDGRSDEESYSNE